MRNRLRMPLLGLGLLAGLTACNVADPVQLQKLEANPHGVATFAVTVTSVKTADGQPFGPGDGTAANPYPFGETLLTFHVFIQALDEGGLPLSSFDRPVSLRITPGDLDSDGGANWLPTTNGTAEGDFIGTHVFGAASVWAMDEPPPPVYNGTGVNPSGYDAGPAQPDGGFGFTFATGTSTPIYFLTPTIQQMRRTPACDPAQSFAPSGISGVCTSNANCIDSFGGKYQCLNGHCAGTCDNRTAALDGDFVTIDQPPPATDMVVTAITSSGFYVTDLAALPPYYPQNPELTVDWDVLPGKFGSVFVYTYSAPSNLYVGDHLLSLSGSVEEFSGDVQLDFPSWIVVDALPSNDRAPTHALSVEGDCTVSGKGVDTMCGYYNSDMALESNESAPVSISNALPSNIFVNCDYNGNGTLPLFANSTSAFGNDPGQWGCYPDEPQELPECACYIACTTGQAYPDFTVTPIPPTIDYSNLKPANGTVPVCSELSTFNNYKQWNVVLFSADGGIYDLPDAGYDGYHSGVRIEVDTADALPNFDPKTLTDPAHQQITFDITGMLNQIQASRPRWLIYARQPSDICCHGNPHPDGDGGMTGICPDGVTDCSLVGH